MKQIGEVLSKNLPYKQQTAITSPTYQGNKELTIQERATVEASKGVRVKDLEDNELKTIVLKEFYTALATLGQGKSFDDERINQTVHQIAIDCRRYYPQVTGNELKMAFQLGARGELKQSPDEVVTVSVASVYNWIKRYRETVRKEAVAKQRKIDEMIENQGIELSEQEKKELTKKAKKELLITEFESFKKQKDGYRAISFPHIYDICEEFGILSVSNELKKEMYGKSRERVKKSDSRPYIKNKRVFYQLKEFRKDEFENLSKKEKQKNEFFRTAVNLAKKELLINLFKGLVEIDQEVKDLL